MVSGDVIRLVAGVTVTVQGPPGQGWHIEATAPPSTYPSIEVRGGFGDAFITSCSPAAVATFNGPSVLRLKLATGGPATVNVRLERY